MAPPSPNRPSSRLKVLVVDDDELMAEVLAIQLEGFGCSVETACDGGHGLARLAEAHFDMVVTDWQMPGIDGMELVRRARAARRREGYLHILMMTARGDAQAMRSAVEAGVDDFIEKPVEAIKLEFAVETARRNRLLHRKLERRNNMLASAHQRTREALQHVRADLEAAHSLQRRLLPEPGTMGTLDLALIYRPTAELGGDTIGAAPLREGGVLLFLIDVKGHGVPAALDSFHLHHRLNQLRPKTPEELSEALGLLNAEVCERGDEDYATIAACLLLPEWEEGWLICAGHPPPVLARPDRTEVLTGGRAMPVGWFPDTPYEPVRFDFPVGSRLVLYSDGVTESTGTAGEEFGLERLCTGVEAGRALSLPASVEAIEAELARFCGRAGNDDDLSLIAIENAPLKGPQ
ncbi:response regulator [Novosphingobium profundi]|uniref:PP2C family protein-serine/threonine phosphatase n=1 Tax=Novosphingobium profundi TaxID=1774954 RepID=UPI001BDAC785|nr:SpoIIE family protein phosphatase [Novosphingobium profundi]MBT0668018.1 response regulator [Novosphingobium profundi]